MVRKSRTLANDHHETQSPRRNGTAAELAQHSEDLVAYAKQYAREKPEVIALWCLGIGFVLGWKLKPW